uniref:Uncharacterized protein n=1 Tax=Rhodnius prolixus TaxID=13249 RepID=T1HXX0_RHOPR
MFRIGFNLWDIFKQLDPDRTYTIPETKFLSVLNGPLRQLIGLEEEEILSVSNLFKKPDGYVTYDQFCQLIHDYRPPAETMEEMEREDPYTVNKNLTKREERMLYEILTDIAVNVTKKRLVLRPFFQDYEMIKKNNGVITKTTFFKVLDFMGARLEKHRLDVLVKRYMRDNYSIKYNAFLKELDEVFDYLEKNNYSDGTGQLWDPSNIPLFEKAPLRGPEVGLRQVFLPNWREKNKVDPREVEMIITKIRDHVLRNKIRMRDFYEEYDPGETDRVDENDFIMGLRWLAYGRVNTVNLYLNPKEVDLLIYLYSDPVYPERKLWKVLEDDVEDSNIYIAHI